jgi:hypothetical protein
LGSGTSAGVRAPRRRRLAGARLPLYKLQGSGAARGCNVIDEIGHRKHFEDDILYVPFPARPRPRVPPIGPERRHEDSRTAGIPIII